MNIVILVFILHFLSDWVLQSPKMGREKSSRFVVLCQHISVIFGLIFLGTIPIIGLKQAFLLSLANALTHAFIDWYIWRGYRLSVYLRNKDKCVEELKKDYKYWLDPVFGYFLGLDQLLHFIILYAIYGGIAC